MTIRKSKKNNPRKGPPFTPGKDVPLKPDVDPDMTEHEGEDPEKNDPTRIEDPDKVDPTRIKDPDKADPTIDDTTLPKINNKK